VRVYNVAFVNKFGFLAALLFILTTSALCYKSLMTFRFDLTRICSCCAETLQKPCI